MEKTPQEAQELENTLKKAGYKKYTSCLTSSEDYAYFKTIKDERDEEKVLYQIAYRFWDWRKYPQGKNIGVDIVMIVSCEGRADLEISYPRLTIEKVEKTAQDFYEFCKQHNID